MIYVLQFSAVQPLDHLDDGLEHLLPPPLSLTPLCLFFHHIRLLSRVTRLFQIIERKFQYVNCYFFGILFLLSFAVRFMAQSAEKTFIRLFS